MKGKVKEKSKQSESDSKMKGKGKGKSNPGVGPLKVENKEEKAKEGKFFNIFNPMKLKRAYKYEMRLIDPPTVIVILAKISLWWEFLFYGVTISTYFVMSYAAFFAYYEEHLWDFIFYTDVVFSADVFIRLSVELWRYFSKNKMLIFASPYTMAQFLLDTIAIIPSHQIYIYIVGREKMSSLSWIDYCRFNRFFRLIRIYQFFEFLKEEMRAQEKIIFLFSFSNLYIVFIHMVSCIFFSLTTVKPLDFILHQDLYNLDNAWTVDFQKKKEGYGDQPLDLYILSTHFAVAVVTTVGYGDITPTNEKEMGVVIVVMLVGAILLSGYFTSQMTNFELEIDGARFDLFFRLEGIQRTLIEVETLPFYNSKVNDYYKFLWTYREGVDKVAFENNLPMSFQEDLKYDICQEMFDKSFLFQGLSEAFLRSVSKIVDVALFNPDMLLCRYGGYANKMFYILQGECRAVSKYDMSKPAGILRAGFLIGETNLFFSYPYMTSVETRTCCQFLILEKEELMKLFDQFNNELMILRTRAQEKSRSMYIKYKKAGEHTISWLEAQDNIDGVDNELVDKQLTMRWSEGLCPKVTEDVIDDTQEAVIFDKKCEDRSVQKNHLTPYMTCVIPEIMVSEMEFVKYWNLVIVICSLFYSFVGPYCLAFGEATEMERAICSSKDWFEIPNACLFTVDVFVEILAACPVYGLYYKFVDGFDLKKREVMFYFDVAAGIPWELMLPNDSIKTQDSFHKLNVFFKTIKMWKVIRLLHYLDNQNAMQIFFLRLGQTILVLMYGIHFIACIFFFNACPIKIEGVTCETTSWLGSYAVTDKLQDIPIFDPLHSVEYLGSDRPYLLSFFFAAATLTSAGFGDFNPQNGLEMVWAWIFQLLGFFLIGYYTSMLTSALSCGVRPKLAFQQKLVSIQQFMNHHHLKETLQDRIVEHYFLQHQFRGGISIPQGVVHFMYDAPDFLKNDVLYLEVQKLLEGIPIFTKCDSEAMVQMSGLMKRFLVPPHTVFTHKGEVRRVMYLIKYGSVGIIDDETNEPMQILESSAHFGIRDMLFGEPCHFTIKTLSHCCFYSITQEQMRTVFDADKELLDLLDAEQEDLKHQIEEMTDVYAKFAHSVARTKTVEKPQKIPSWICIPSDKDDIAHIEYDKQLKSIRGTWFLSRFLMRRTLHPVGMFSKIWICLISVVSSLVIMALFMETYMGIRNLGFRFFQISLDLLCYADVYLKLHWSYYIPENSILVSSPLLAAYCYIMNGSFFSDVIVCAPFELLTWLTGHTNFVGSGSAASWFTRLKWTRFFQIKRIPNIFQITHNVFESRNFILLVIYVAVTLLVCTIVSAVAVYLGCPWYPADWHTGDENRLPLCLQNTWATKKLDQSTTAGLGNRWIVGVYYVSQVILVIGFGDMITLSSSELILLIFMTVFGFIFMRCVIADITAAEVDSDEIRANFIERLTTLQLIMAREYINPKLIGVTAYLNHTWVKAKGLQPQELFADLHPSLESDLYHDVIRDRLFTVPILASFQPTILRTVCQYMRQLFFVKGQRLMRFGNLEYEMYIIVEGRVWIADKDLNYVCSMAYGESFGEASLLYGTTREYNAIASGDVEVYVLSAKDFASVQKRYPAVQELFESKLRAIPKGLDSVFVKAMKKETPSDLFVKKVRLRKYLLQGADPEVQHKDAERTKTETVKILEAVSSRELLASHIGAKAKFHQKCVWKVLSYFVGIGHHDQNLSFMYIARSRAAYYSFVFHPNCMAMEIFLTCVNFLCYITPAIATYEISFSQTYLQKTGIGGAGCSGRMVSCYIHQFSQYCEMVMCIFMFLSFFTAVETEKGYFIKDTKTCALCYLLSLPGFFLDFISLIPFFVDIIADYFQTNTKHGYLFKTYYDTQTYFYLLKVLRLYRYYQQQISKKDDLAITTFRYKMTLSISSFCLMAHALSCIFYYISACTEKTATGFNGCPTPPNPKSTTWTYEFSNNGNLWMDPEKMKPWRWWVRSLYWVATVISTTGFGDVTPMKIAEMAVAIICMFCGSFVLSIILSHFTSGMASITKFHREYLYQVKLLVKHLRNIGLSKHRQDQVMSYFLMVWDRSRGIPYNKAVQILPVTMRIEVSYALYLNVMKTVKLFHLEKEEEHQALLRQISLRLSHSYYIPGVCIVKEGDKGASLFIVFKGKVLGCTKTVGKVGEDRLPKLEKVYNTGDVFGKFPALFRLGNLEESYRKSYRAEEAVEILELQQSDILHLTEHFPRFLISLSTFINHRYTEKNREAKPIFEKVVTTRAGLFDLGAFKKTRGKKKTSAEKFTPLKVKALEFGKKATKKPSRKKKKLFLSAKPTPI